MDRYRGGDRDRYGDAPDEQRQLRRPSRFSDAPPNTTNNINNSNRGGFAFSPSPDAAPNFHNPSPVSGHKRPFPFSPRPSPASPPPTENYQPRNFVKLFIGSVPKTATDQHIRPLFEDHGNVMEVTLIRDKRTGEQQGCCFVKYATSEEANRAIQFLHNQYTLPGGTGPIQVRYADGERERLGNAEVKLFVGSLNRHAAEKEVEELFAPYGHVEDVYLMRDDRRQSRGCGFVKFSEKDSAMAAINALNGSYTMRGCEQPLIVRFADPKRPRTGDQRGVPSHGGANFAPIPVTGVVRPPHGLNFAETMGGQGPATGWQPSSPHNIGASQNVGSHGMLGNHGSQGVFTDGSIPSFAAPSSSMSPQLTPVTPATYSKIQASQASGRQTAQLQFSYASGEMPNSHGLPSQQYPGLSAPFPASQSQPQQNASSAGLGHAPLHANLQPNSGSSMTNPLQLPTSSSEQLPLHQSASQLAQMLAQQRQSLQASLQSSQQTFSQLQQQLQSMQPSPQHQQPQPNFQTAKHQQHPQWSGVVPQAAGSASGLAPSNDLLSTKSIGSAALPLPSAAAPLKCNWTEHVSPDGFKYYYNSVTSESSWEKPEDLTSYEQQQPKLMLQHPQGQPGPNALPSHHVPQSQQPQLQTQLQHPERLQQIFTSSYQTPGAMGNQNVKGHPAAQEWMWKNKSEGS